MPWWTLILSCDFGTACTVIPGITRRSRVPGAPIRAVCAWLALFLLNCSLRTEVARFTDFAEISDTVWFQSLCTTPADKALTARDLFVWIVLEACFALLAGAADLKFRRLSNIIDETIPTRFAPSLRVKFAVSAACADLNNTFPAKLTSRAS